MQIRGIAHRGYPSRYPENTLSSFQAACDMSFTHLELDVHLSKDGIPVVIHDFSIDRMCNGKGKIRDYTVNELKRFLVGEVETIPTLAETLHMLKGKIGAIVELKQTGNVYPGLEEAVLEVVRRTDTFDQVRIISFDHFSIARTRRLNRDIELGVLCSGSAPYVFGFLHDIRCTFLGLKTSFLTPQYAEMMRENEIICNPGVVDSLEEMELVAAQYPESLVTTNELSRWAEFVENRPELNKRYRN